VIRDARPADTDAILALNLESEALMSPMDAARLAELSAMAAYLRVVEDERGVAAFLLAFREGTAYDSVNYRWFDERYPRFLYVDRIAVAGDRQGRGLGPMLYADLFDFARAHDVPRVVCEYYSVPLNERSRRFHQRAGFVEVGSQWLPSGKQVSFQEKIGSDSLFRFKKLEPE
jgi:predicted GNAT superfamily acetyltransferase